MKASRRNYWYFVILLHYEFDLSKNFFELEMDEIGILGDLAEAIRCKGENGKSPARTLWDRAKKGRPF